MECVIERPEQTEKPIERTDPPPPKETQQHGNQ